MANFRPTFLGTLVNVDQLLTISVQKDGDNFFVQGETSSLAPIRLSPLYSSETQANSHLNLLLRP